MSRIIPLYLWLVFAIIAANHLLINATKYILIKIVDEEEHAGKILDISILIISYDLKYEIYVPTFNPKISIIGLCIEIKLCTIS